MCARANKISYSPACARSGIFIDIEWLGHVPASHRHHHSHRRRQCCRSLHKLTDDCAWCAHIALFAWPTAHTDVQHTYIMMAGMVSGRSRFVEQQQHNILIGSICNYFIFFIQINYWTLSYFICVPFAWQRWRRCCRWWWRFASMATYE